MVNESQRRGNFDYNLQEFSYLTESYPGSHTPQGRVTAVSQHILIPHARVAAVSQRQVSRNPALPVNVPTINNPSFFQNYFENHAPSSSSLGSSSQNLLPGYSTAHLHYQDERKRWASMAYKTPGQIPLRAQPRQEVRVLFQLSHQLLSGKVEKVTVLKLNSQHLFFILIFEPFYRQ